MPHLSPPTLTITDQRAILRASACNLRDHLVYSLALGTGLRLAEIVGLDIGDVYTPEGKPRGSRAPIDDSAELRNACEPVDDLYSPIRRQLFEQVRTLNC